MSDRGVRWVLGVVLSAACGSSSHDAGSHVDASADGGGLCVRCADADAGKAQPSSGDGGVCTACVPQACEEAVAITSHAHVNGDVKYPDPPPAGGAHNPCWADWGVHTSAVADEHWVHNLEHGGVVYLYNCPEGCPDEVSAMATFVQGRTQALLTPYPLLPKRFAVVSWGHRLVSDCFDRQTFEAFYTNHVDHGLESLTSYPPAGCHDE